MTDAKVDSTISRPLAELAGQTIGGRYRIDYLVGHGGAGAVYAAEELETGAAVAIKIILPGLANADEVAARFRREGRASSLLAHPNIVAVRDVVGDGDDVYLVMELLHGRTLDDVLQAGALAPRRALAIARQVLDGLGHAHSQGLIHRDMKPGNIMLVGDDDLVKLLDFGLVKLVGDAAAALGGDQLTQAGLVFGTPAYVAPEQALGKAIDHRADLYSLGVVVFEMLAGRPPFRSPDAVTLARMHASAPAPALANVAPGRPWCTPALEQLIARALAKQPDDRFATAAEMIAAVDAAVASLP